MSLQSSLVGFLISRMLPTPLTPQEIVIIQTTASATGTMPLSGGFVGILPALGLMSEEQDGSPPIHLSWTAGIGWYCFLWIVKEQLAFPTGAATAQLISVLHDLPPSDARLRYQRIDSEDAVDTAPLSHATEATDATPLLRASVGSVKVAGWRELLWSFFVSAVLTLIAYFFPVVYAIPLFGNYLAHNWLWSFTPSLSYVGQGAGSPSSVMLVLKTVTTTGIIMGLPTAMSMNLGTFVGWAVLSPISKLNGWAPGLVGDMTTGARVWTVWVALAVMSADSCVSLAPVVYEYLTQVLWYNFRDEGRTTDKEDDEVETEDRLIPTRWVVIGLAASVALGTLIVGAVFGQEGIRPWATIIAFILGGIMSILGVRALGETDMNPVSGLGKISQLFFAWVQPGNIVANIIAGGVAEAGAGQAAELMQDLKPGHLCGASPRAQFYGQMIGSCVSIFVTTTVYNLYTRAYSIPGPSFPAPTAYVWLNLARLLRDGKLPEKSSLFMGIFALAFGLVAALKTFATRKHVWWAKWIPSGIAFAMGAINTPSFSLARLIGGILEYIFRTRYARDKGDIRLVIVASGFVLGEGVTSVVSLVLRTFGVGVASCWGCPA
ncbi:OPT superfamily [Marasmius crinis-equi]|uniref:OPT superfamily n=1 Tax=Marasmius crinis-equi TaxID=585013 RepID=A0ABR3FHR2_9AGAR